ncbi:MAG: pilus assembly protein N-terminal domain-containing protein [Planctomycetes bacterium]|nr:pilus assembly protein N-terminal domain-containing protein [Planctomycetota bacterium]
MHRTIPVPEPSFAPKEQFPGRPSASAGLAGKRLRGWRPALALLLTLLPARTAPAQPAAEPAPGVVVPVNGSEIRQMSTKKRIKSVAIGDPRFVRVVGAPADNTSVYIVGLAPGISTVTLTDENDKAERFEVVVVAFDIRQLQAVLRRAVPTANVTALPAGVAGVILTGTVDRAEDVPAVLQATQSVVGGLQIINFLRVGNSQQVQLCVVVARVNRSKLRNFGFNFLFNSRDVIGGSTVGQLIPPLSPVGVPSQQLQPTFLGAPILNSGPGAGNIFVGAIHQVGGFLGFLQALETEGLAKILAEPRLVVMSGRQGSFLDGGEQAIPVPAGLGQIGVQFEEFGTRLNCVPIVLGNGKIHLEVEPEVSALDAASGTTIGGATVPGRLTQRVRTTVEIETGQTLVIGGLIQHNTNATLVKVPVLGSLPFLGAAFSTKTFQDSETELVILITPHLVDPMDCAQLPKVLPGLETRNPDDFELFLEGILEAPRGPREVFPDGRYRPAYKNGPTAALFPSVQGASGHGHEHLLPGLTANSVAPAPPAAAAQKMPLPAPQAVPIGATETAPAEAVPSTATPADQPEVRPAGDVSPASPPPAPPSGTGGPNQP